MVVANKSTMNNILAIPNSHNAMLSCYMYTNNNAFSTATFLLAMWPRLLPLSCMSLELVTLSSAPC